MSHERIIDDDDLAQVRAFYERRRGFMLGDRNARLFKLAVALVKMTPVVPSTMKQ